MKTSLLTNFSVDKENKKISVEREFAASVAKVWDAWTKSDILNQWWAPKPWKARTKSMDFREGGSWLYAMVGPEGEEHWAKFEYESIKPQKSFSGQDAFCDPEGNINTEFPRSKWGNEFKESGNSTIVSILITYDKLADLEAIIKMGFKEGFLSAMENLDAIFEE